MKKCNVDKIKYKRSERRIMHRDNRRAAKLEIRRLMATR